MTDKAMTDKGAAPVDDATQRRWARDFANVTAQLAPYVRTTTDGFRWVDEESAPPVLVRLYRGLLELGYARGWMP